MNRKRDLWSILIMAAIVAVTLWLVLGDGRAVQVWAAMSQARWSWLALGGALMLCYAALEAVQYRMMLREMGHKVPYRHCVQFAAVGFYFSSITPSATGGQPAEVYYMARRGIPAAHGALTMLLFTIVYQAVLVGYGLGAWLVAPWIPASLGTGLGFLLGFGATTMILLTAGMLALLIWPGPVERLCRWILGLGARLKLVKDRARAEAGLACQMEEYTQGAAVLKKSPGLLAKLLVLSALQLGSRFLIPWTVYRAMGLSGYGVAELVGIQALVALAVNCLPIPGAVGASEAAFLTACATVYGQDHVTAAMLLSRGLSFYLPLVVSGTLTALVHLWTGGSAKGGGTGKTS